MEYTYTQKQIRTFPSEACTLTEAQFTTIERLDNFLMDHETGLTRRVREYTRRQLAKEGMVKRG
jgi:hypothetical protein